MDIVHLTGHFAPHFEGGTEAVVRAHARELARLGHRVRVVAGTERPYAGADLERAVVDGIEVVLLPRKPGEYYDLDLEYARLRPLVAELVRGAELVHVHKWLNLHSHLVRDAAASARVVVSLHDLFVTCPRHFRLPPDPAIRCPLPGEFETCARCVAPGTGWSHEQLLAGFARRTRWIAEELAAAHALVVPSRSQVERIGEHVALDPARLHVVPNGLPTPLARVIERGWDGTGRLRVLFLGHRTEVKGVRELVAGIAALPAESRARVELLLLGEELSPGFDDELRAAANGVALIFSGSYRREELSARLAALGGAHLGAFPSRAWESYGLVLDEMQALGLPVWVSDRGAPQERVGRAGRVLPAENAAAWTRALAEILAEPAALERERQALPAKPLGAPEAVQTLLAVYRSVLR